MQYQVGVENFYVFHSRVSIRFLMTVILSALAFFILLSALILIHEFGHFIVARKSGVVVEEFGFGLPPRAKTLFKKGGTWFTLNWIPFGGFVRLKGENALTEKERRAPGSFAAASIPRRIAILVAGVFMNFILAIILLTIGFSVGEWIPTYSSFEEMQAAAEAGDLELDLGVFIDEVMVGSAAAKAGVPAESILLKVDDTAVSLPNQIAPLQEGKRTVEYTLLTGENLDEETVVTLTLDDGKAGVGLVPYPRHIAAPKRSIPAAFVLSLRESKVMTHQTILGMGQLFMSLAQTGRVPEGISGIVGIAKMTHASVQQGLMTYLRLVALLSLSLAVLNILPFPALDGGRLLFVLVELVRRRPVNRRFEVMTNALGFIFLILLIILITFNDIVQLF